MSYLLLKALHVGADFIWISGLLALALTLAQVSPTGRTPAEARLLIAMRRWDGLVTTPAMALALALGLTAASMGGWFPAAWLLIKIALATALAAFHGVLSGIAGRLEADANRAPPRWLGYAGVIVIAVMLALVALAVLKPG